MLIEYNECLYKSGSAYFTYVCDDDVEEITCSGLTAVFRQDAECDCRLNAGIYDAVGTKAQIALQEEIYEQIKGYSAWNDALDCDIQLECFLAQEGTVKGISGVNSKSYILFNLHCPLLYSLLINKFSE